MGNKTILIVDDAVENLDMLGEFLSNYDVIDAISGEDALDIVENEEKINLILLDIMMPDMDGYEVCEKLKNNPNTADIPVIFTTAKTDEDSIEKAYDVGGIDYITKPFKLKELLARVKRELKLQSFQEELKLLASTDPLTKLYNRRYFIETTEHLLNIAKREPTEFALIMLDIDKFKNINDSYGHQVGDNVIIQLANILIGNQRKSDIICRYGGEEFVILLVDTSIEGAEKIAEKIRESAESDSLTINSSEELSYTVSLGVAQVNLLDENSIESALKRADDALYRAKESGRNRVCISVES